jgi:hypothetical protein
MVCEVVVRAWMGWEVDALQSPIFSGLLAY